MAASDGLWSDIDLSDPPLTSRTFTGFTHADLRFPRSQYQDSQPTLSANDEADILEHLATTEQSDHPQSFKTCDLTAFSIYRNNETPLRRGELTGLHSLNVSLGADDLYFDGIAIVNNAKLYLKQVEFRTLSIGGYGDEQKGSVRDDIYIQTSLGARHSFWYLLKQPSREYKRYHGAFLWLADFGKFFIEYLLDSEVPVTLAHFKKSFDSWVKRVYGESTSRWRQSLSGHDFRSAVSANIMYLWNEMHGVDESLQRHPIWKETMSTQLEAIRSRGTSSGKTIVTPFVANVFKDMHFAHLFKIQTPSTEQVHQINVRRSQLGLLPFGSQAVNKKPNRAIQHMPKSIPSTISAGAVVAVRPDAESAWRGSHAYWLAYVQQARAWQNGRTKLDLLWLYRPEDTSLRAGNYPFPNELFLSDNCSCGRDAYDLDSVLGLIHVLWPSNKRPRLLPSESPFVRTAYMSHTHEFVTLTNTHFRCPCHEKPLTAFDEAVKDYKVGDFVLIRNATHSFKVDAIDEKNILEPVQLLRFQKSKRAIFFRLLRRAGRDEGHAHAPPNEVVWTDTTFELPAEYIVRRCEVRGFNPECQDPLFRRDGVGDLFFYKYDGEDPNDYSRSTRVPRARKLRGMSLCCGGGSFDRGLEEGGAVDFEFAIDFDTLALHSYRANIEDLDKVDLYLGPMEEYLADCITERSRQYRRATVGEVEIIAAGNPCTAFSNLQPDKLSNHSLKNASLAANVMSYVDYYSPQYVILENVTGIAAVAKGHGSDQNVLSQMLCCFVGLGYQTQQIVLDAPAYGSFQNRRRVFVLAAAPGFPPLDRPPQTHLTVTGQEKVRSANLGKLSNGTKLGGCFDDLAPFPMVTFGYGTKDLPFIGDGHVHTCISHPDHRLGANLNALQHDTITMIPKIPRKMGLAQANALGKIPERSREMWLSHARRAADCSKTFSRVDPDRTTYVVTTAPNPLDAFNGCVVHPFQDRILTVLEARRAQGIPDHEVILGQPREQWKIIGNSVHRHVAFALGLSLRDSWQKALSDKMVNNEPIALPRRQPVEQKTPLTTIRRRNASIPVRTVTVKGAKCSTEGIATELISRRTTGGVQKRALEKSARQKRRPLGRYGCSGSSVRSGRNELTKAVEVTTDNHESLAEPLGRQHAYAVSRVLASIPCIERRPTRHDDLQSVDQDLPAVSEPGTPESGIDRNTSSDSATNTLISTPSVPKTGDVKDISTQTDPASAVMPQQPYVLDSSQPMEGITTTSHPRVLRTMANDQTYTETVTTTTTTVTTTRTITMASRPGSSNPADVRLQ